MQALLFAQKMHTPRVKYLGRKVVAKRDILRLGTGVDRLLPIPKALLPARLITFIDSEELSAASISEHQPRCVNTENSISTPSPDTAARVLVL